MIHLLTIIGARPQIIKAAALSRVIRGKFASQVSEHILHTGQHYDSNMSQVFFDELGIPAPEFNLSVGSGHHGEQTAKMIMGIEQVLLQQHFDGIVLYGDTNSTLAGAVAASKLHIPVFHIEAGLRSFNMNMPEEVNRIVCDQLSAILFAPTQTAVDNLCNEGLDRRLKIVNSGDIMLDNCRYFSSIAEERSTILQQYDLTDNNYILATIHRDNNTDDPTRLDSLISALESISADFPVVLPLHPRTAKILGTRCLHGNIKVLPPASFLDMLMLEKHSTMVLTDSGGVQKEAFFLEKPCVILRPETEWVEIVENGAGVIVDADYSRIISAYHELLGKTVHFPPLFGDGNASNHIVSEILSFFN